MLRTRELSEPSKNILLVATLPVASLISFGAILVLNVGSFAVLPFAVCAEGLASASSIAVGRMARVLRGARDEPETP